MNHCPDCHAETKPGDRHLWKCEGAKDIPCDVCWSPAKKAIDAQIRAHIKEHGFCEEVQGVFGDHNKNKGYVEAREVNEHGACIKFYGCSYLYKGDINSARIDSVATVKRTLMATIRFIFTFPRWNLRSAIEWFVSIYEADLEKKALVNLNEFSPLPRELIRAGYVVAARIPLVGYPCCPEYFDDAGLPCHREYRTVVRKLIKCIATFIQADSAYYYRVADPLLELDKKKLTENPRKEIRRLFDLMLAREHQITPKIQQIKKFVLLLLLIPKYKRIAVRFLLELNQQAFRPDEADHYFNGRKMGYDFGGKDFEARKKRAEKLDEEKNHYIIQA